MMVVVLSSECTLAQQPFSHFPPDVKLKLKKIENVNCESAKESKKKC